MKKILLPLILLVATFAKAQKKEGIVSFQQKMNLHRSMPNMDENMKAMIPEYRTSEYQLAFTAAVSLYKEIESDEEETDRNGNVRMTMRRPKGEVYYNLKDKKRIELREMMDKKHRIEGEMKTTPWKITEETKMIQGLPCMKATFEDTTGRKKQIEAWFTPAIPYSIGPESYGGLPGMILEVIINEGEMLFTATKIDYKTPAAEDLAEPKGGTPISEEDYRKEMKEMRKKWGGGNGRVIMRN
jgi:GLPGLI family protein